MMMPRNGARRGPKQGQIGLAGIFLIITSVAIAAAFIVQGGRYSIVGIVILGGTACATLSRLSGYPSYVVDAIFYIGMVATCIVVPLLRGCFRF